MANICEYMYSDRQNELVATDIVLKQGVVNFCIMFIVLKLIFIKGLYVPEILQLLYFLDSWRSYTLFEYYDKRKDIRLLFVSIY